MKKSNKAQPTKKGWTEEGVQRSVLKSQKLFRAENAKDDVESLHQQCVETIIT